MKVVIFAQFQTEGWAPKNWCFQIVVLEETLERPLDCKEIKAVNLKGNQPWIFIGRTDAEAETPILWSPDAKSWLRKRPWCRERLKAKEKGVAEDEMVKWHYWLNGREFEQTLWASEDQGSLACCSPSSRKESDKAEQLSNNNNLKTHEVQILLSQITWDPYHMQCGHCPRCWWEWGKHNRNGI